jgi:hypothetical protein
MHEWWEFPDDDGDEVEGNNALDIHLNLLVMTYL